MNLWFCVCDTSKCTKCSHVAKFVCTFCTSQRTTNNALVHCWAEVVNQGRWTKKISFAIWTIFSISVSTDVKNRKKWMPELFQRWHSELAEDSWHLQHKRCHEWMNPNLCLFIYAILWNPSGYDSNHKNDRIVWCYHLEIIFKTDISRLGLSIFKSK